LDGTDRKAGSEAAYPTAGVDSAPDDLGETDLDAMDLVLTVAAVRRHHRAGPLVAGHAVCSLRPALLSWVYRFARSATAARLAFVDGLVNVPEGAAKMPAAPPSKNTRPLLESSAQRGISLSRHLLTSVAQSATDASSGDHRIGASSRNATA